MSNEDPSLSIRPTRREIRRNQLKDLEKPGWVIILHDGQVITKPIEPQETEESK
jgi:hypothetical protein